MAELADALDSGSSEVTRLSKYIIKRIALGVLSVFIVATLTFFLMNLVPGGPFVAEKSISKAAQEALNVFAQPCHSPQNMQSPKAPLEIIYFILYHNKAPSVKNLAVCQFRHIRTCDQSLGALLL